MKSVIFTRKKKSIFVISREKNVFLLKLSQKLKNNRIPKIGFSKGDNQIIYINKILNYFICFFINIVIIFKFFNIKNE